MRTSYLIVLPCILIAGLLFGAYQLKGLIRSDAPCALGACPTTLYEGDTGRTFIYAVGTLFTVTLNELKNPLRGLICSPEGVVEMVGTPFSEAPLYTATFRGLSAGSCTLANTTLVTTIVIQ